jgi:two-component system KDP operon response regulator KdpE
MLDGRLIPLPPSAFDYLVTLVRHAPNPVPFETLVMQSQGYEMSRAEAQEMARWRIHQLRQALEPDPQNPRYILTERGMGYRLAP